MASFKANEAENYGGGGGTGFFSINQDKGTKQVRIMYNGIDDVEGLSVHKVKLPGAKYDRYVNCLRAYNDPVDNCPFCKAGIPCEARVFVPLYNMEDKQVQLWDKGKTMFSKLSGLCSRYASNGRKLVNCIFEIQRFGAYGDKNTTYEIYFVESDNTELRDLPEVKPVLGPDKCLVLSKSYEDMEYYVAHKEFPDGYSSNTEEEEPVYRRSDGRRTPATMGRGEAF